MVRGNGAWIVHKCVSNIAIKCQSYMCIISHEYTLRTKIVCASSSWYALFSWWGSKIVSIKPC